MAESELARGIGIGEFNVARPEGMRGLDGRASRK
jgi:hypothetical protein